MTSLTSRLAVLAMTSTFVFAAGAVARSEGALPASPAATPSAAPLVAASPDSDAGAALPMPTACSLNLSLTVAQTVGRAIDDPVERQFVLLVRRMSEDGLEAVSRAHADDPLTTRIGAAVNENCLGSEASVVTGRAFIVATLTRQFDLDADKKSRLIARLLDAAGAISARDHLPAADVTEALAPFDTSVAGLTASAPAAPCSAPDTGATIVEKLVPPYPGAAMAKRESGTVRVLLHLDADGIPTYVRYYPSDVLEESPLVDVTLAVAAGSTYRVKSVKCLPVAQSFLFVAQFEPGGGRGFHP